MEYRSVKDLSDHEFCELEDDFGFSLDKSGGLQVVGKKCKDCIVGVTEWGIEGEHDVFFNTDSGEKRIVEMAFSFCPICGRKL